MHLHFLVIILLIEFDFIHILSILLHIYCPISTNTKQGFELAYRGGSSSSSSLLFVACLFLKASKIETQRNLRKHRRPLLYRQAVLATRLRRMDPSSCLHVGWELLSKIIM
jgi:hypothetical protein